MVERCNYNYSCLELGMLKGRCNYTVITDVQIWALWREAAITIIAGYSWAMMEGRCSYNQDEVVHNEGTLKL